MLDSEIEMKFRVPIKSKNRQLEVQSYGNNINKMTANLTDVKASWKNMQYGRCHNLVMPMNNELPQTQGQKK
jgi:hypothetical protein